MIKRGNIEGTELTIDEFLTYLNEYHLVWHDTKENVLAFRFGF